MSICPYVKHKTALRLDRVRIRLIEPSENEEWNALFAKYHYFRLRAPDRCPNRKRHRNVAFGAQLV